MQDIDNAKPAANASETEAAAGMSLSPSPDIAFALKVIEFFEPLRKDLEDQISLYDEELYRRFDKDYERFKDWSDTTDYPFLNAQLDRLINVIGEMTTFVRVRECRTIGDLLAKMRLDDDWVKLTNEVVSDGYAEYAAEMLRSILPLTRRIGALPASETVSQQA